MQKITALVLISLTLTACSSPFVWKNRTAYENAEEYSDSEDLPKPEIPAAKPKVKTVSSSKNFVPPITDPAPPPQHVVGLNDQKQYSQAELSYSEAFAIQTRAEFLNASELWKLFLSRYPANPLASQATYNLGLSLYSLGNYTDSIKTLKPLFSDTSLGLLEVDLRLLYAENLIEEGRLLEALSISYEIFPDKDSEERVGITRVKSSFHISADQIPLFQVIRTHLLRARAYLGLFKLELTSQSLLAVENLLQNQGDKLKSLEFMRLKSFWGWRKLQFLSLNCSEQNPFPKDLSEEAFLAYVEHYYSCIEGAKKVFCTIHQNHFEAVEPLAVFTLKEMVLLPLKMKSNITKSVSTKKTKKEKQVYESEMNTLIDKKVSEYSLKFKNLDECGVENLYE